MIKHYCFMCGERKAFIANYLQKTVVFYCTHCGSSYPAEPTRKFELLIAWLCFQYNKLYAYILNLRKKNV